MRTVIETDSIRVHPKAARAVVIEIDAERCGVSPINLATNSSARAHPASQQQREAIVVRVLSDTGDTARYRNLPTAHAHLRLEVCPVVGDDTTSRIGHRQQRPLKPCRVRKQ